MRTSTEEVGITVLTAATQWAERRVPIGFDGDGGAGDGAGASEGDQSGAGASGAGASGDGGSGGTQGASESDAAFEARIARLESSQRQLQGERDKALAKLAKLEKGDGGGGESQSVDVDAIAASIEARFTKREEMRVAAAKFSKGDKFQYADQSIFERAAEFDSPEALEAALEASHRSTAAIVDKAVEQKHNKLLAEVEERYGVRIAPPGGDEKGEKSADPTLEQIEAMSLDEMADFEFKNPGVIKRVLSLSST